MAKDPAFLFYPNDWLGGTMGMSFEEKGAYIELLVYQFNRGGFSERQVKAFLRNDEIWESLKAKFEFKDGLYFNKRLEEEKIKRVAYTESRRQSRLKSDEDNVRIYIVRDNVRLTYKIGSSVNPIRRYNELNNQVSPAIMEDIQGERNISLIWYSNPVERKTEKYLHNKFNSKRLNGEWFSLDEYDLQAIQLEFVGVSYEQRTLSRTENENINSNSIVIVNKKREKKIKTFKSFTEQDFIDDISKYKEGYDPVMLNNFFIHWKEKDTTGKMRFQLQTTWETNLRLAKWKSNNYGNGKQETAAESSAVNDKIKAAINAAK